MPLPFAAAITSCICAIWPLVIMALLLWWFIQAFFKYRWFRWVVLILFLLPVGTLMAFISLIFVLGPRHAALSPPSAAAPAQESSQAEGAKAAKADQAPATLVVLLPAEANLWVEGKKTTQSGRSRTFQTPPLDPDQDYEYASRAVWLTGEGFVDQTRHVKVRAGGKTEVDFNGPEPAAMP
jgi:uncharacterized protein (TIGR03000 family)